MVEFKMPSLGADMTEGTLTAWNVDVGDTVERGDIICEVETNKGDIDVEVWHSGVVQELLAEPGQKLPVGEVLAVIDTEEEEVAEEEAPEKRAPKPTEAEVAARRRRDPADLRVPEGIMASPAARRRAAELGVDLEETRGTGLHGSITIADVERAQEEQPTPKEHRPPHASPVARRMADEEGIDLDTLRGTGPGGSIRREDVEAAIADQKRPKAPEEAPEIERDAMVAMREAIATAMARSKREIPHYYLHETVPMDRATDWLTDYNADRPAKERLLMGALLVKAVALACRRFPEFNGIFEDDRYKPRNDINPGFAISLRPSGVIPPAIHRADEKALPGVMDDIRDLVRRVRRGKLRSSEVMDATITVNSLGDRGVDAVYGIIYPPQVAIVGFGKITERTYVEDGRIGTHRAVTVTLSGDHRASDGITGARFLSTIGDLLQRPEEL